MKFSRLFWLLILFGLAPAPLRANSVANLYSASVPVASQAQRVRANALHGALAQVIVKVTGSRSAPDAPAVADIVGNAEHYLQAYRYVRHVPRADEPVFGAGPQPTLDLWARFDRQALDRALRAAGQPLWGSERPATVVWIAYQQGDQRHIVNAEAPGKVLEDVQETAAERGLPIIFPLMDIEDRNHVTFSDVWGGFAAPVVEASRRYQPNAVLIGRIDVPGTGSASAHWTLVVDGRPTDWDGANGTPAEVAGAAMQHLADVYASKFVIKTGAQTIPALRVVVAGINDLAGYGQVLNYLRSLSPVEGVEPTRVSGDTVTFTLSAQGNVADIRQTIALGALLVSVDRSAGHTAPAATIPLPSSGLAPVATAAPMALYYRYQP